MNLITPDAKLIFMTAHGGGGELSLELTAPVVLAADDKAGGSVTFTMLAQPPQPQYAETRLYRYDAASRSFCVLDATLRPGDNVKTVSGLQNLKRYAWLPVALDIEGKYIPAAVLSVLVTDGSLGVVESVKRSIVQVLRDDPGLAAYHPQWGDSDETRGHVLDGAVAGGRNAGRTPFIEVETKSVSHASPFVIKAAYQLNLAATQRLDELADDVLDALSAQENRWLQSKYVMNIAVTCGTPERGFPIKRLAIVVETELAARA